MLAEIRKAIVGGILAGLTAAQVALNPVADQSPDITAAEWIGISIAVVGVFAGVWGTTNQEDT